MHGLNIKNLNEFIMGLPLQIIDELYKETAAVLTVFRELDEISQNYIYRLLFETQPISQQIINSWVKTSFLKMHQDSIFKLTSLNIFISIQSNAFLGWVLNKNFQKSFQSFVLHGDSTLIPKNDLPPDKHAKSVEALEKYGNERWECVLHYMVGAQDKKDAVSKDTKDLLQASGLMNLGDGSTEPKITKEGFQFLLLDTNSQIWYFLLYHFELLKDKSVELVESLKFLLQLNFSVVGQDYPSTDLSPTLNKLLQNLRELGIVYQRKRSDGRFYPTPLAVSLISNSHNSESVVKTTSHTQLNRELERHNKLSMGKREPSPNINYMSQSDKLMGHIIVETNFRIYAYSDSDLQIKLLGLFCDMQYRFPKFCIGIITRESIRSALKCGITALQIINYLRIHAHPITLKKVNPVPLTVCDQIMLWELEKTRLLYTEAVLYDQFQTRGDYDSIYTYAEEINAIEWSNRTKKLLVVNLEGHEQVKNFWKSQKNSST